MELSYKKQFLKDIQRLPPKIQLSVKDLLDKLKRATDLESSGVDYARMEGQKASHNYYRLRVGSYRQV